MDIKISEEALHDIVQKAILDQLDGDARERIISEALKYLLAPGKDSFSQRPSPLENAFRIAVTTSAGKIVHDLVANDPTLQRRIKEYVGEALAKMDAANFTDYLGSALSAALRGGDL